MKSSKQLLERIRARINEISEILKENGYEPEKISEEEFYQYLTGETPYKEKYTLEDVLKDNFLMLHEVVEISELKRMGIPVNKRTVIEFHSKAYEAHLTATDVELSYAFKVKNFSWIRTRLEHLRTWEEDELLPPDLLPKVRQLLRKYAFFSNFTPQVEP